MKKLTLFYLFTSHLLVAQGDTEKSFEYYIASIYDRQVGVNSTIYTGAKFVDDLAQQQTEGNYYYYQNDWTFGKISLSGQLYDSIRLRYNLVLNQLIILNHYTGESLVVQKEKLDYFELYNTRFVFLLKPEPGYYAQLTTGTVKPYVQYSCIQNERILNGKLVQEMVIRKKYFLQKDGTFYSVKSRRSALRVFGADKNNLKRKLRQSNIGYSAQKDVALSKMSQFYDQLKNEN